MMFAYSKAPLAAMSLVLLGILANGFPISSLAQAPTSIKKQPTSPPKNVKVVDVVIKGQVFVVTKGGANFKLGLVRVSAYVEKDLLDQFGKTFEAEQAVRESAFDAMQEAKTVWNASEQAVKDAKAKEDMAYKEYIASNSFWKGLKKNEYEAAREATTSAHVAADRLRYPYLKSDIDFRQLTSHRHFIERLGDSKFSTKSDADGNFELTLPTGSYALVGTGQRMVADSTELYSWIVRVEVKSSRKVLLSNDNMADTNCDECIPVPGSK